MVSDCFCGMAFIQKHQVNKRLIFAPFCENYLETSRHPNFYFVLYMILLIVCNITSYI